jgi:hypothetical protein
MCYSLRGPLLLCDLDVLHINHSSVTTTVQAYSFHISVGRRSRLSKALNILVSNYLKQKDPRDLKDRLGDISSRAVRIEMISRRAWTRLFLSGLQLALLLV